ncbi:hypothetical protein Ciccas_002104 [Cichlidogyrus casuarinus]|uniref:Uncharacterized protein n=1 Tax=Cichlidogyrus casuarinus TaxID=1844966 RepID=A0ABD2QI60_9PLAT
MSKSSKTPPSKSGKAPPSKSGKTPPPRAAKSPKSGTLDKINPIAQFLETAVFKYPVKHQIIIEEPPLNIREFWDTWRPLNLAHQNTPTFTHREWYWSPNSPVITRTGHVWVSDSTNQRIFRYEFCPFNKHLKKLEPILVNGQPRQMCELADTCRVAVVVTNKMNEILIYDLNKLIDPQIPVDKLELPSNDQMWKNPCAICSNSSILFVAIHPLQDIQAYCNKRIVPITCFIENYCNNGHECVNMNSIAGIAASDDMLYVLGSKSKKIYVFTIKYDRYGDNIANVTLGIKMDLTVDRLGCGGPIDVQVDAYQNLVVSDYKNGMIRYYSHKRRTKGLKKPSLPSGELTFMGAHKFQPFNGTRLGYFSISKNGILVMVDRKENQLLFFYDLEGLVRLWNGLYELAEHKSKRPVFDSLVPLQLPDKTFVRAELKATIECDPLRFPPIDHDTLLPEYLAKQLPVAHQEDPKSTPKSVKKNK